MPGKEDEKGKNKKGLARPAGFLLPSFSRPSEYTSAVLVACFVLDVLRSKKREKVIVFGVLGGSGSGDEVEVEFFFSVSFLLPVFPAKGERGPNDKRR